MKRTNKHNTYNIVVEKNELDRTDRRNKITTKRARKKEQKNGGSKFLTIMDAYTIIVAITSSVEWWWWLEKWCNGGIERVFDPKS